VPNGPISKTWFENAVESFIRRLFPRFVLPHRRYLTPFVLALIVTATLLGSWLVAWDRTIGNQHRLDEASQYLLNRDFESSLELYNKILSRNPRVKIAWTGKGLSLLYLGRFEEALDSYDRALKLDPDYLIGFQGKGLTYERLGRFEEALACYEAIMTLKPGTFNAADQIERVRVKMAR